MTLFTMLADKWLSKPIVVLKTLIAIHSRTIETGLVESYGRTSSTAEPPHIYMIYIYRSDELILWAYLCTHPMDDLPAIANELSLPWLLVICSSCSDFQHSRWLFVLQQARVGGSSSYQQTLFRRRRYPKLNCL